MPQRILEIKNTFSYFTMLVKQSLSFFNFHFAEIKLGDVEYVEDKLKDLGI